MAFLIVFGMLLMVAGAGALYFNRKYPGMVEGFFAGALLNLRKVFSKAPPATPTAPDQTKPEDTPK